MSALMSVYMSREGGGRDHLLGQCTSVDAIITKCHLTNAETYYSRQLYKSRQILLTSLAPVVGSNVEQNW